MATNIYEIRSDSWTQNINWLIETYWIKKWRKISYKWVKYQIVDVKDFSITITNWDGGWLINVSILELFNWIRGGDIRLLNKARYIWVNWVAEDVSTKIRKITQNTILNIENEVLNEKKRYLKALWISLWANKETIESFLGAMLKCYNEFININCYLYITEQEPSSITIIEKIWKHFVSAKNIHLSYNIWCIVLAILREDIGSAYYKNLEKWINERTNWAWVEKYKEAMWIA